MRILLAFALFFLSMAAAVAQETPAEERSYFIGFVEDQLSGPNRQIRIENIQGVLSSNATIGLITIADREGVWLRIVNARIVWTRSALLLGRLDIETLAADQIEVLRQPVADESLPAPEAGGFSIPELPISVDLANLEVPLVSFGPGVFGLESRMSINGRLRLADGSLDTALDITRLDGPGGRFALAATYANASQELSLDLSLNEPENGIVANLIGIEGRPPITLTLKGAGPVATLELALTLDAAGERVLEGTTNLRRQADGTAFAANLGGPIAKLIPPRFRDFFGADTRLETAGTVRDAGGLVIDKLTLNSAALTLSAELETTVDNFLKRLNLNATVGDPAKEKTLLPMGGETTVNRAALKLSFGETGEDWSGTIELDDLSTTAFAAKAFDITLGGLARNLNDPAARSVTFKVDGAATGLIATDAGVAAALGDSIRLNINGDWKAGGPVNLGKAEISANGFGLSLAGQIADYVFDGTIAVDAQNIAPFSGLAGRDLSGALDLDAKGKLEPLTGAFDLAIDGVGTDLTIGTQAVDNLISGTTRIAGGVARGAQGLVARQLKLFNDRIEFTADGSFATGAANFGFNLSLADLSLLSDRVTGRLTANGKATGSDGLIGLTLVTDIADGSLVGRRLTESAVTFEGTVQDGNLNGQVAGSAFLDGVRIELASGIAVAGGETRLDMLKFTAGGARLDGDIVRTAQGLLDGKVTLAAADISTAASLFLTRATGAVNAEIALSHQDGTQAADVKANIRNVAVEDIRIGRADANAAVRDLFNVPAADGRVTAANVSVAGIDVATLDAQAKQEGTKTSFDVKASLKNGTNAAVAGALSPVDGGYKVELDRADLAQGKLAARLVQPTSLLVQGQDIRFDALALDVGGGRIEARGEIAQQLNLSVAIRALPLGIANAVKPDLGLAGTIDGTATIGGTRTAPQIAFDLKGRSIAAAALRQAGLQSVSIDASGTSSGTRLELRSSIASPDGLRATVAGAVPLGEGALALDVNLQSFPLSLLNVVAPGQGLGGTVSGTARVTGPLADPAATFQLRGVGIRAAPLDNAGLGSLEIGASGSYARNVITLSSANALGPGGLSVSGSGRIPLAGSGLDVSLTGSAPLSLANRFLADRGTQLSGTLSLSANVSGSLAQPSVRGMVSTIGAQAVDPDTNLRLRGISVMAAIDGGTVTLRNASATLASGGTVSASGTISTAAGFPADIRIVLDNARYADGNLVVATLSGNLALTGSLARDPLLSGNVTVNRAEIMVPENFTAGTAQIDVKHINPPKDVRETLRRAKANDGTPMPTGRPSVVRLDISVSAPNRLFVRGRGLDAELGGSVRLTGPITSVQPVGAFELIRGRLSILGQRITFDEGTVTLVGDLDPFLNFVARSGGNDITVFITVSGRVSDLDISFSSQPNLPEDEVLARLIFNRSINELSAFQIAQLAAAAAELAGGSNSSLLGSLRNATGLDDLDVVTDSEGNAAVRAGRYIQDNIYLGVEAGAKGTTRGTINLDITEDLKARGAVGSDGDSSVGVFFEKDY